MRKNIIYCDCCKGIIDINDLIILKITHHGDNHSLDICKDCYKKIENVLTEAHKYVIL